MVKSFEEFVNEGMFSGMVRRSNTNQSKKEDIPHSKKELKEMINIEIKRQGGHHVNLNNIDVHLVKDMSYLFNNKSVLRTLDISKWNTKDVNHIEFMFSGCTHLQSVKMNDMNFSSVKNMEHMFCACEALKVIEGINTWKLGSVTNAKDMFICCKELEELDLSAWDTKSFNNIDGMFSECQSLKKLNIGNWNVNSLTSMNLCFNKCKELEDPDLTNWKLKSMELNGIFYAFQNCNLNYKYLKNRLCHSFNKITAPINSINKIQVNEGMFSGMVRRANTDTVKKEDETQNYKDLQEVKKLEFIDFGLESGILWSPCNFGSTDPKEPGRFFSLDELVELQNFLEKTDYRIATVDDWDELNDDYTVNKKFIYLSEIVGQFNYHGVEFSKDGKEIIVPNFGLEQEDSNGQKKIVNKGNKVYNYYGCCKDGIKGYIKITYDDVTEKFIFNNHFTNKLLQKLQVRLVKIHK